MINFYCYTDKKLLQQEHKKFVTNKYGLSFYCYCINSLRTIDKGCVLKMIPCPSLQLLSTDMEENSLKIKLLITLQQIGELSHYFYILV